MDALVGNTADRELLVLDDGAPDTTATLTYSLWSPAHAVLLNAVAMPHDANGYYKYSVDGSTYLTTSGTYEELIQGTTTSGRDVYVQRQVIVGYLAGEVVTRRELRHRLARRLRDLLTGVATAGAAGSLTDSSRWEDNLRGAHLYIYAGTGKGQERRISDQDTTTGQLSVVPNWTVTPDTTSRYEIHGLRHQHWTVDDYNTALNEALTSLKENYVLPVRNEELALLTDTHEYTIPSGFHFLNRVYAKDTTAASTSIYADWIELANDAECLWDVAYEVIPGRILHLPALPLNPTNWQLRLVGSRMTAPMEHDDAFCDAPSSFIVPKAAVYMLTGEIGGPSVDPEATAQTVAFLEQQADKYLPRRPVGTNAARLS